MDPFNFGLQRRAASPGVDRQEVPVGDLPMPTASHVPRLSRLGHILG